MPAAQPQFLHNVYSGTFSGTNARTWMPAAQPQFLHNVYSGTFSDASA